jgi:homoserine O-succinyltransferase
MPVSLHQKFRHPARHDEARFIDIGLINNMPDAALQATERQFLTLLNEASGKVRVRVWLYTLPGIPRSDAARRHIETSYSYIEDIWNRRLDGLIVTGAEPRAQKLADEPYWGALTRLIDWAENNTLSSVWSCLAAHAAILHIDGIRRRPLRQKCSGVFECVRTADHPLTDGIPSRIRMPHSRWNSVTENDLTARDYRILTRVANGDVDIFVKEKRSAFVFFQGHPEYDTHTLLREYRRDLGRYLNQETGACPQIPEGYFAAGAIDSPGDTPATLSEATIANTWSCTAARIYGNWLTFLCGRKNWRPHCAPLPIEASQDAPGSVATGPRVH